MAMGAIELELVHTRTLGGLSDSRQRVASWMAPGSMAEAPKCPPLSQQAIPLAPRNHSDAALIDSFGSSVAGEFPPVEVRPGNGKG